jgi:alpha-amylase
MNSICFYFHVHQPFQLVNYNFDQIGHKDNYENINLNKDLIDRFADNCYLPANLLLMDVIKKSNKKFRAAISISGTTLDLFELYRPDVIKSFNKLFETGCIEVLAETYYHSLSAVYAPAEFTRQVKLHTEKIKKHFNIVPKVFSNTGFPINNSVAQSVSDLGYKGMVCDGLEPHIQGRSTTGVLGIGKLKNFGLLVRNKSLSDDISIKYGDKSWSEFPLTASKFSGWIETMPADTEVINLFMNYTTFGIGQAKDSGIFTFFGQLAEALSKSKRFELKTPSEMVNLPAGDTVAFAGMKNKMQEEAIKQLYKIEKSVLASKNKTLLCDWGRLQSMDHLLNMTTDQWVRGGEHPGYFDNPYDAHISFMNILKDIEETAAPKTAAETIEAPVAAAKKATAKKKEVPVPNVEQEPVLKAAKSPAPKKAKKASDSILVETPEENIAKGKPVAPKKASAKTVAPEISEAPLKKEKTPKKDGAPKKATKSASANPSN